MFASHVCDVLNSTSESITCRLNTSKSPMPFERLEISVQVRGLGQAIVAPAVNHTTSFEFIPSVEAITPRRGSIAGGTTVVIRGQGFVNGTSVSIGGASCDVTSVEFTQIECVSPTSVMVEKLNQSLVVSLVRDNHEHRGMCKDSAGCMFDFMNSQTPHVTNVQPSIISSPNSVITLNGSKVMYFS